MVSIPILFARHAVSLLLTLHQVSLLYTSSNAYELALLPNLKQSRPKDGMEIYFSSLEVSLDHFLKSATIQDTRSSILVFPKRF